MITCHIHIKGRVQGVGFRPHVYRMAKDRQLMGWVINSTDGVHIRFTGEKEQVNAFYQSLIKDPPRLAVLSAHTMEEVPLESFQSFEILESQEEPTRELLLTPDFALCEDCREELHAAGNRRYEYAFTTCTNCGPRYSIIRNIPYDRVHTTMNYLEMCTHCKEEFYNPKDRRYYSQTNSCPDCAIQMQLSDAAGKVRASDAEEIMTQVAEALAEGQIIAVKGIGGYLLMLDAANKAAISRLRKLKKRPNKPFAVMYPSLESAQRDVVLSEKQIDFLKSPESPIVLAKHKPDAVVAVDLLAPENPFLGIMIPYAPLFELILHAFGKPVVATSGNVSGAPIVYSSGEALRLLSSMADLMLHHDREMLIPQDDSVVQLTVDSKRPIFLRRSRGYAPSLIHNGFENWQTPVLAMGGELKNTFAIQHAGQTYVSQYLGDMKTYDTQEAFQHTLDHLSSVLGFTPSQILCDEHPGYFTNRYAASISQHQQIALHEVQHHEAHFAAVLGENQLLDTQERVLGVIWDGTGWGNRHMVWGGEFFLLEEGQMVHFGNLQPFPHMLGDKMAREPRLSALSLLRHHKNRRKLQDQFSTVEWQYYNQLLARTPDWQTTSMGRLFDGVSAMLGLKLQNTFEAEAAMALEFAAMRGREMTGGEMMNPYNLKGGAYIPTQELINAVVWDKEMGLHPDMIAWRFHLALAYAVKSAAEMANVQKIAFSGGVFQNALLVALMQEVLHDFHCYFHVQLPPNDECISFGQLAHCYLAEEKNRKKQKGGTERIAAKETPLTESLPH